MEQKGAWIDLWSLIAVIVLGVIFGVCALSACGETGGGGPATVSPVAPVVHGSATAGGDRVPQR